MILLGKIADNFRFLLVLCQTYIGQHSAKTTGLYLLIMANTGYRGALKCLILFQAAEWLLTPSATERKRLNPIYRVFI